ncbi:hypothetical protein KUTG_01143 [Kutzneria sp. 744]|nr:hypothetical protein KUTG_01143 [Kutzneria sp. 744]
MRKQPSTPRSSGLRVARSSRPRLGHAAACPSARRSMPSPAACRRDEFGSCANRSGR